MNATIELSELCLKPGAMFSVHKKTLGWSDWKDLTQDEADTFCADLRVDKVNIKVPESVKNGLVSFVQYELTMMSESKRNTEESPKLIE